MIVKPVYAIMDTDTDIINHLHGKKVVITVVTPCIYKGGDGELGTEMFRYTGDIEAITESFIILDGIVLMRNNIIAIKIGR